VLLKFGKGKIYVGYDLGTTCSQISYCLTGSTSVETLSAVAGEESFNIPTVLCKRHHVNQWLYGKEAIKAAGKDEGILVENLLEMALDGEPVLIEGNTYEPAALLTLFMRKSLNLLSMIAPLEKIEALTITCERMDKQMQEIISLAVGGLNIRVSKVYFQSYMESYYYFMLHQPEELIQHQSMLFDYDNDRIKIYQMKRNDRATPVVILIHDSEYPFRKPEDSKFLKIAREACGSARISSVYLIGERYSQEWMTESLRFLCEGRRVFQGSNLYSKGACYGMLAHFEGTDPDKKYVYLGHEKLKANVGMNVCRQGEDSYYVLLDAGINWYEADSVTEFYLQEDNTLELLITSLTGTGSKVARITLEGFKGAAARLKMHLFMKSETRLVVEVENLGFGELIVQAANKWREEMELY